ncbi:MAG: glycosyltransferase family 9 protein [bacterium]|nr:glycosyltransferase family 9 protein [bacterium]
MSEPTKLLIVRPDALGDMVFTLPLISALKHYFNGVEVWVLASPYTRGILDGHPDVDGVIEDWKNFKRKSPEKSRKDYVAAIKSFKFDAVVLVYMDLFYARVMSDAGIPVRIGDAGRSGFGRYLTRQCGKVNFRDLSKHEVELNMQLVKPWLGGEIPPGKLRVYVTDVARDSVRDTLKERGLKGDNYVVIHPSIGAGNREWYPERYAALNDKLQAELGVQVVLTGGPNEANKTAAISAKCKRRPIDMAGKSSIGELMAILESSKLVIGAQTGPVHLASALGVPVLSVSPTKFIKSFRWGPWKVPHLVLTDTSTCPLFCNTYKTPCSAPFCVDAIGVSAAFDAARKLLELPERCPGVLDKVHWFQKSGVVLLHVQRWHDDAGSQAMHFRRILKSVGVRVLVSSYSASVARDASRHLGTSVFCARPWQFRRWVRFLAVNDVTIWHFIGGPAGRFSGALRQLSALKMYVPPVIVQISGMVADGVGLIKEYLVECQGAR